MAHFIYSKDTSPSGKFTTLSTTISRHGHCPKVRYDTNTEPIQVSSWSICQNPPSVNDEDCVETTLLAPTAVELPQEVEELSQAEGRIWGVKSIKFFKPLTEKSKDAAWTWTDRYFKYPVDTQGSITDERITLWSTTAASGGNEAPASEMTAKIVDITGDRVYLAPVSRVTREDLKDFVNSDTLTMFDKTASDAFGVKNPDYELVNVVEAKHINWLKKSSKGTKITLGDMDWIFAIRE